MVQDSRPKCRILPLPLTKIQQVRYVSIPSGGDPASEFLAVSTEDGRIIFYISNALGADFNEDKSDDEVKVSEPIAQFGGASDGLTGRIKDFEMLRSPNAGETFFMACGSDGIIRIWVVEDIELTDCAASRLSSGISATSDGDGHNKNGPEPIGQLIGLYETSNRITCVTAFLMSDKPDHKAMNAQAKNVDEDEASIKV